MVKRALLIGINYIGGEVPLKGCINDIKSMHDVLLVRGYTDIVVLRDDDQENLPTKIKIVTEMKKLAAKYSAGDQIYIHYSGHGSYVKDTSGDEADGRDECICPVDYAAAGFIIDDDIKIALLSSVPAGCRIRVVFDACHSGTAIDLPVRWIGGSKIVKDYKCDDNIDCIFLSGCQDNQTSADARIDGSYSGALTYALLQSIKAADKSAKIASPYTWKDIGLSCQIWLKQKSYKQVPQLGMYNKSQLATLFDI